MNWTRHKYYLESECERFTISKTLHNGVPKYTAWRGSKELGIFTNASDAEQACIKQQQEFVK